MSVGKVEAGLHGAQVERAIATAQAFFQIAMIKLMARRIALLGLLS